jgi:hypothetical protein
MILNVSRTTAIGTFLVFASSLIFLHYAPLSPQFILRDADDIYIIAFISVLWAVPFSVWAIGKIIGSDSDLWITGITTIAFVLTVTSIDGALAELKYDLPFWSSEAVQMVFGPLIFLSWLSYRKNVAISKILMILGIPLGLVGVMINVNSLSLHFITELSTTTSMVNSATANAYSLIPAVYGGLASLVGYFLHEKSRVVNEEKISFFELFFFIFVMPAFWVLSLVARGSLFFFVDLNAFLVVSILCSISVFLGKKNGKGIGDCLLDAAIYSAVISLIMALVLWYASGINPNVSPIKFASTSLMYSAILYVFSFLLTLYTDEKTETDFPTKNWHLVETYTFFIFLVFAPISISDYLYNEKENIEQKIIETELRIEIKNLSERLAALEKVSLAN